MVLKPVHGAAEAVEVAWLATALVDVSSEAFRLAAPVLSEQGERVVDGWRADRWVAGREGPAGRWPEVLAVADAFCAAVAHLPRPPFLEQRQHPWARADRAAWGEQALDPPPDVAALATRLRHLTAPPQQPPQLVHGDLAGNVLFHPDLPPAVVDVSPYWRPAAHASAVAVADALVWWGEGPELLAVADETGRPALVARALLFRLLVHGELLGEAGGSTAGDRGLAPFERATAVVEQAVRR